MKAVRHNAGCLVIDAGPGIRVMEGMQVLNWLVVLEWPCSLEPSAASCSTCIVHLMERLQCKCVIMEQYALLLQGAGNQWSSGI